METMQDTHPRAGEGRAKTLRRERDMADFCGAEGDFGADTQVLLKEIATMTRRASEHAGVREHIEPGTHEYEHLTSEIQRELALVRMAAGLALNLEGDLED